MFRKKFPLYTQLDAMDCGPTCLAMIAKYYGRTYTLQNLRKRSFVTRQGVSMLGISDAAESIGFRTVGVKISFDSFVEEANMPCILHWNQNHFVVCYDVKRKGRTDDYIIKIADPSGEKYTMNKQEFLKCWGSVTVNDKQGGIAMMLSPTPEFDTIEDDEQQKKRI